MAHYLTFNSSSASNGSKTVKNRVSTKLQSTMQTWSGTVTIEDDTQQFQLNLKIMSTSIVGHGKNEGEVY